MAIADRKWADVYVPDDNCRWQLQSKALFYIPAALDRITVHKLNASKLGSKASEEKRLGNSNVAGKQVIKHVMFCKRPVTYESALNFINLFNLMVPADAALTTEDIVGCVFRLRDIHLIEQHLGLKADAIATGSGVPLEIVDSAIGRYRITYDHAHKIWDFLAKYKVKNQKADWPDEFERLVTSNETNLIVADERYQLAVKQLGHQLAEDDERNRYVYERHHLIAAPKSGHFWAIH